MIKNSFTILPGVGRLVEQRLWQQGIRDWDGFLNTKNVKGIAPGRKAYYDRMLTEARKNLYQLDAGYFKEALPPGDHWRLYGFFREECCYLDIETSGVERDAYITVVGLFDGLHTKVMVRGSNMDFSVLRQELSHYKIVVSFNGSVFDAPALERHSPGLFDDVLHFDLRHGCARLGLSGGLKHIERELGIKRRNEIVSRMYGGDAIQLWKMYRATGDEYYLNLLIEYNEEDVVNLKQIADYVYEHLAKKSLEQAPERGKSLLCRCVKGT